MNVDPRLLHSAAAAHLQPAAQAQQAQQAPALMGNAATVTLLVDLMRLPDGSHIRLPAYPELQVQTVTLAPGERLLAAERLLLRHALVQRGELWVAARHGGRAEPVTEGQWALDDGGRAWAASEQGPVQLLVLQHLRRLPGAEPSMQEGAASAPLTLTTDYTGEPITMPDAALRVLVNRYEVLPNATLPWHLNPHQRYAYVERGQLEVQDLAGRSHVYGPGETVVEQRQTVHRGINRGAQPVSLLVFDYVPKEKRSNTVLHPAQSSSAR
ncbi:hypothetical protein CDN98_09380 [Roseateles terrae]|nr:hypothetical protein CDN98_09380 [Roseateles terrae]